MKNTIVKMMTLLLCLSVLLAPVQAAQGSIGRLVSETSAGLSALDGKPGTLLGKGDEFPAGTSVCDWTAMALALTGSPEDYDSYLRDLEAHVQSCYAKDGGLDRVKSTTYHRIALVMLALGGDPECFGQEIDLIADGTYAFAGDSVGAQGLNGWIYALLALDASGAEVPENAKFTRENMVSAIITAQEPDGGFGLMAGKSDVDITAMALQALAPYQGDYPDVIEAGLAYLSGAMNDSCRFDAYGESAESSAQVILALCALGIDPEGDSRFCRGSQTLLTGLEVFRQEDGTYGHTKEDTQGNYLATAQTLLALKAVQKLRAGEGWIFDFSDYEGPQQKAPQHDFVYAAIAAAAVLIICIVIAGKRKKYGKNNR